MRFSFWFPLKRAAPSVGGRVLTAWILFCLLIAFSGGSVFGAGRGESEIRQAERYIKEKQYNEAILILTRIIRDRPEIMPRAEKLLRQIREKRNDYNDMYEQLIRVLYQDHDVEKALGIIDQIEQMDQAPNQANIEAIARAKDTAEFIYSLDRFTGIMDNAAGAIAGNDYWKAVRFYLEGFDLQLENFLSAGYGNILTEGISGRITALERSVTAFLASEHAFKETVAAALGAVETAEGERRSAVEAASGVILELSDLIAESESTIGYLRRQGETLSGLNGGKEDFHISYVSRLLNGRNLAEKPEGITYALGEIFSEKLTELASAYGESGLTALDGGIRSFVSGDTDEAASAFLAAHSLSLAALRFTGIWESRLKLDTKLSLSQDSAAVLDEQLPRFLAYRTAAAVADGYRALLEHAPSDELLAHASRAELDSSLSELLKLGERWDSKFAYLVTADERWISGKSKERVAGLTSALERTFSAVEKRDVLLVARSCERDSRSAQDAFSSIEEKLETARGLLNGSREDEDGNAVVKRYPERAIAAMKDTESGIETVRDGMRALIGRIDGEKAYVRTDERIVPYRKSAAELLVRCDELESAVETDIASARQMILLAKKYRQEGDLRFSEAESAIQSGNFDVGRQKILRAQDNFLKSLSYMEDQQVRSRVDAEVARLSELIVQEENRVVIREVRKLINEGKSYYLQGIYEKAEDVLLNAQTRWSVTNSEANPEVEYWLGFVKSALFVKSNREIQETDPLYPEMSQLLNLAQDYYNRGREELRQGNRARALEYFNDAEEKLLRVKIPFPFNREANILPLKILAIRDNGKYRQLLAQRFSQAKQMLSMNAGEAYMMLKDIQEIEPGYPGLQDALYRAEIVLKIRIPPPDPKALAQSDQFYRKALALYQKNDRTQFSIAIEQLSKAIELNSDNQKAIELKDRIQMIQGGQLSLVLSSDDQQEYRVAEERFIQGKYFESLQIVEKLLKKRNNQRYVPLQELKRRIESKI